MKDKAPYIIILLFLVTALFVFVVYIAIPKAAALTLPYKWSNVPLAQKQIIVHQYLGKPTNANSITQEEQWVEMRENGEYVLTVFYKDSVANNYSLIFYYHLSFFHKNYDLKPKPAE